METLTDHIVNPVNDKIKVQAVDEIGSGGARHHYVCGVNCMGEEGFWSQEIKFQNGPIADVGVNGTTHEVLLSVLAHRLRAFQAGPYACRETAIALTKIEEAQLWLQKRTRDRMKRGVEGTMGK